MSSQPRYSFDPVTQKYTLLPPVVRADAPVVSSYSQPQSGLGAIYDAGGGGDAAPAPEGSYSMSPETAVGMQNFGLAMQGVPSIGAQVVGSVVGGIPSAYGYATPTPVDNPVAPVETAIAPTDALAAMNTQVAEEAQQTANQAAVSNVATTAADVAAAVASTPGTTSAPASAAASSPSDTGVSDAGGSAMGDSGAGVGDVGGGGGGDSGGGGDGGGSSATGGSDSSSTGSGASDTGAADSGWRRGGQVMNYESGGLAAAAKKIQGEGRKGDTMLVHMAPEEVRGLQAIAMQHGGSLTINPETGLVEANFLKSILPVIAGAALAPFTGGASMAALLVGGGTALMTGSLEKGLMAGLGAFGGASLAGSLSAAGAASTAGQTITPQLSSATAVTPQAVVGGTSPYALTGGTLATPAATSPYALGTGASGMGLKTAATQGLSTAAGPVSQVAGAITPAAAPVTYGNMSAGIKALGTEAGRSAFMQAADGPMGLAKTGLAAASPLLAADLEAGTDQGAGKMPQANVRPYSFDFNRSDVEPGFRYRTGTTGEATSEQRYLDPQFRALGVYKSGSEPGPSVYGPPSKDLYKLYSSGGIAGLGKGGLKDGAFVVPADVVSHLGNGSNDAGQKLLARGLGARPIKGKGDGMSDSIPTSIEGKQPARVADGEAYIPPEVVKKVGAKRLYNMMAKIRKARTGTNKQAPEVDPREFMPA